MRRFFVLCLCLAIVALGGGQVAVASQVSTPVKATARAPLDLATMLLIPADVKRPQAAIWSGGRYFLDAYRAQQATALQAAGDRGGFEQWLGPPTANRDYQVASAIDEFTDAKGAAAGYPVIRGSDQGLVRGVPTVGVQSALFRVTGTDPYDATRPDHGLVLVFRVDRLVGTIYVDDYTTHKPHAAEAIALGKVMVARITQILAGDPTKPGLSNRAVRFNVPVTASFQDGYYRLNGQDHFGWEGKLAKGQPTFDQTFRGATTVLLVGQYASTAPGAPWERVRLVQFPTATAASAWLTGYLALAERGPGGWQQVTPVSGAKAFGEQSQTVTFQRLASQGAPGKTVYGTAITTRYGALVVSVRIEAYQRVPVVLVQDLMAAQEKCLKASGTCPRVTPSQALLRLTLTAANRSTPRLATAGPAAMTPARRCRGEIKSDRQ